MVSDDQVGREGEERRREEKRWKEKIREDEKRRWRIGECKRKRGVSKRINLNIDHALGHSRGSFRYFLLLLSYFCFFSLYLLFPFAFLHTFIPAKVSTREELLQKMVR